MMIGIAWNIGIYENYIKSATFSAFQFIFSVFQLKTLPASCEAINNSCSYISVTMNEE